MRKRSLPPTASRWTEEVESKRMMMRIIIVFKNH